MPARTTRHRRRPSRGEGRQAILDAVVRLIARGGFDALTYRSVAEQAGVTHGLVSYHFASREAMIHEALVRAANEAIFSSAIAPGEGEDIADFATSLARLVADDPEGQVFQHQLKLEASRRPAIADDVREMRRTYDDTVQRALETFGLGRDEALARLVLAALDGLVLQQLVVGDPLLTDAAVERLHALLELARDHGLVAAAPPTVSAA